MMAYLYIGIVFCCLVIVFGIFNLVLPDRICEIRAPGLSSQRKRVQ